MSVAEVRLKVKVATREKGHTKGHTKLRLFAADPSVAPFFSKAKGGGGLMCPLLSQRHPCTNCIPTSPDFCPHSVLISSLPLSKLQRLSSNPSEMGLPLPLHPPFPLIPCSQCVLFCRGVVRVQGGQEQGRDGRLGQRRRGARRRLMMMMMVVLMVDGRPVVRDDGRGGGEHVGSWGRSG